MTALEIALAVILPIAGLVIAVVLFATKRPKEGDVRGRRHRDRRRPRPRAVPLKKRTVHPLSIGHGSIR